MPPRSIRTRGSSDPNLRPLAILWTSAGSFFVPAAISWAFFALNGLGGQSATEGARIGRSFFGLIGALLAGSLLVWTAALYVRKAKEQRCRLLVPPNILFEDSARSPLISWGTVWVFALIVLLSLGVFGSRYFGTPIYSWNKDAPLAKGFFESRAIALHQGCDDPPCFSLGHRDLTGKESSAVEYIPWVDDGGILLLFAGLLCGFIFLLRESFSRPPTRERDYR